MTSRNRTNEPWYVKSNITKGKPAQLWVVRNDGFCWGRIVTETGEELDVTARRDQYERIDDEAADAFTRAARRGHAEPAVGWLGCFAPADGEPMMWHVVFIFTLSRERTHRTFGAYTVARGAPIAVALAKAHLDEIVKAKRARTAARIVDGSIKVTAAGHVVTTCEGGL